MKTLVLYFFCGFVVQGSAQFFGMQPMPMFQPGYDPLSQLVQNVQGFLYNIFPPRPMMPMMPRQPPYRIPNQSRLNARKKNRLDKSETDSNAYSKSTPDPVSNSNSNSEWESGIRVPGYHYPYSYSTYSYPYSYPATTSSPFATLRPPLPPVEESIDGEPIPIVPSSEDERFETSLANGERFTTEGKKRKSPEDGRWESLLKDHNTAGDTDDSVIRKPPPLPTLVEMNEPDDVRRLRRRRWLRI